ncbi:QueC-like queuosine biosynthesis [Mycobacterium phage Saguaro]|uniref:7-cyano-7-deazaguanine synthase n=1 Tax=Mycobacterium phage Saguaro TaxID=2315616 RepID=A0A386K9C1_9CAUD|nr:QueC-like queuosine biosynthesis [Mycobacterium phage Saguaro]AYD81998.1 Pre Qo pathway QueC-like protein [Mycobacterium phage Saguaro]
MTLVLLSGGMDSSTLLAFTNADAAVFIDYGQRHIREYESAVAIAEHYGVPLYELSLREFGRSVASALTSRDIDVPEGHYTAENMATTVVPNRNAVLLSCAAGIAASVGLTRVVTAVHSGDHAIYPDCREDFINALDRATELSCGVRVEAPFVRLDKTDIARMAGRLGVPLEMTWSCYQGGEVHCGRCGTCVERMEAIDAAGMVDLTGYADSTFWREQVGQ